MTSRAHNMIRQWERIQHACPWVLHGITPTQLQESLDPKKRLRPKEEACLQSHRIALEVALSKQKEQGEKHRWFAVMEDDLIWGIPSLTLQAILRSAPEDAEILQLHLNQPEILAFLAQYVYYRQTEEEDAPPRKVENSEYQGYLWAPWKPTWSSSGCYLIRSSVAARILRHWKETLATFPRTPTIDDLFYSMAKTYTFTFPITRTLDEDSEVNPEHLDIHRRASSIAQSIYENPVYMESLQKRLAAL